MAYINPYQQAVQGRAKQRKKRTIGANVNPNLISSPSLTDKKNQKNIRKKGGVGNASGGIRPADDSTDNKVMGALAGGFSLGGGDSGSMLPNNNAQSIVTTTDKVGGVNNQSSPTSGASATSSMQGRGGEQTSYSNYQMQVGNAFRPFDIDPLAQQRAMQLAQAPNNISIGNSLADQQRANEDMRLAQSLMGDTGTGTDAQEAMRLAQGDDSRPANEELGLEAIKRMQERLRASEGSNLSTEEEMMRTLGGGAPRTLREGEGGQGYNEEIRRRMDQLSNLGRGRDYDAGGGLEGLTDDATRILRERLQGEGDPSIQRDISDYLKQSEREEKDLIARLNSMGVLRGGDTAEALGDLYGARDRTIQDMLARGYDQQSSALRDVLDFQRGEREKQLTEEDLASSQVGRELDVAGVTGDYRGSDTLQKTALESDIEQRGLDRDTRVSEAELDRALQRSESELDRGLRRDESAEERGLRREELTGDIDVGQGARDSLAKQELDQRAEDAEFRRQLDEAGVTGRYRSQDSMEYRPTIDQQRIDLDERTVKTREDLSEAEIEDAEFRRQLDEAGVTGEYFREKGNPYTKVDTLDSRRFALDEADVTGMYQDEQTMREKERLDREETADLSRRLAESGVTGTFETGTDYQGRPMVVPTEQRREREAREELARAELTGDLGGVDTLARERGQREERALTDDLVTSREARRSSADDRRRKDRALDIDERRIDAEIDKMKSDTTNEKFAVLAEIATATGSKKFKDALASLGDETNKDDFVNMLKESFGMGAEEEGGTASKHGTDQTMQGIYEDLNSDNAQVRQRAEQNLASFLSSLDGTQQRSYQFQGRA